MACLRSLVGDSLFIPVYSLYYWRNLKKHLLMRSFLLQSAAGQCIYDRLKIFPTLPSPVPQSFWKTNERVILTTPSKKLVPCVSLYDTISTCQFWECSLLMYAWYKMNAIQICTYCMLSNRNTSKFKMDCKDMNYISV